MDRGLESRSGQAKWICVALTLVVLAGTLFRFYRLGEKSFWLDEVITAEIVHEGWDRIEANADGFGFPPPYYFLVAPLERFEVKEWWLRLPSAVAGSFTLILIFFLARPWHGEAAALSATVFAASSHYHLYYSQDARPYAIAMAIAAAFCGWVFRIHSRIQGGGAPSRRLYLGLAILAAAGVYFHYFLAFLAVAGYVFLFLSGCAQGQEEGRRKTLIGLFASALLGVLLLFPQILKIPGQSKEFATASPDFLRSLKILADTLVSFGGGNRYLAASLAVAFLVGIALSSKCRSLGSFTFLLILLPMATFTWVAPVYFFFSPRWLCFLFPIYAVGVGLAVSAPFRLLGRGPVSHAAWAGLTLVACLTSAPEAIQYFQGEKSPWRQTVEILAAEMAPGDVLVAGFASAHGPLAHYIRRRGSFPPVETVERCVDPNNLRNIVREAGGEVYYVSAHRSSLDPALLAILDRDFTEVASLPALTDWGGVHIWRRPGLARARGD